MSSAIIEEFCLLIASMEAAGLKLYTILFNAGYGAKGIMFCVGELRKRYQTGMLYKHTYAVDMKTRFAFSRKIII